MILTAQRMPAIEEGCLMWKSKGCMAAGDQATERRNSIVVGGTNVVSTAAEAGGFQGAGVAAAASRPGATGKHEALPCCVHSLVLRTHHCRGMMALFGGKRQNTRKKCSFTPVLLEHAWVTRFSSMSERLCVVLAYVDEGHCHGRTSFVLCIHVEGTFLLCHLPKSPLGLRYAVTKGLSHDCLLSGPQQLQMLLVAVYITGLSMCVMMFL
jgi:hypothetical protein